MFKVLTMAICNVVFLSSAHFSKYSNLYFFFDIDSRAQVNLLVFHIGLYLGHEFIFKALELERLTHEFCDVSIYETSSFLLTSVRFVSN